MSGQAKLRGTYEERKAQAIARKQVEEEERKAKEAARQAEYEVWLAEAMARGPRGMLLATGLAIAASALNPARGKPQ